MPTKKVKHPLSKTHPRLAREADGWDPSQFSHGSQRRLTWKCKLGHRWNAPIARRAGKQKSGCPYCSNNKVLVGFNDLKSTNPELISEVDGWNPEQIIAGSRTLKPWKCKLGHRWNATPADRSIKKSKCPYCSNSKVLTGFNDLATEFPNLAKEADGWDPSKIVSRTGKPLQWRCINNHSWRISPNSRIRKNVTVGCPFCLNHFVLKGFNDLATTHPHLIGEAFDWDPTKIIAGSSRKLKWKCSEGHVYVLSVNNRTSKNTGCGVCWNRQIEIGYNDLQSKYPEIAQQAYGWDPSKVSFSYGKKLKWKCELGHVYEATPSARIGANRAGCQYCSNRKILVGFNDLQTQHPEIARQAHGWDPQTLISGSHAKREWKCNLGHIWRATLDSRVHRKSGCPVCANKIIQKGLNDLLTTHPHIANQASGWDPSSIFAGSHKKLLWQCEFGHEWRASVVVRTSKNSGCPTCFGTGYDSNLKGWFYLIKQLDLGFTQIGISNYPEKRLSTHAKKGWVLIELRGPLDGMEARDFETNVLRMLQKNGAKIISQNEFDKFDGYTEAWITSSFPINSIKELMQLTEEFDQEKGKYY